jgi:hypothetical protein
MNTTGDVVSASTFTSWITNEERKNAALTKQLPPYARVYYPTPTRNAT